MLAAILSVAAPATCPGQTPSGERRSDTRIDAETGRDRRIWPPDRLFDHVHMLLEVTIPDMARHEFAGTETLRVQPIGIPREAITLDAGKGLTFSAVTVNGKPARFGHDKAAAKLKISFDRSYAPGENIVLVMRYDAVKPGGGGSGLTWSRDDRRTPEVDYMMHVQGEPQNNHLWYPCHDFPNERLATELIITVPEPYEAVSNGALVAVARVPLAVSQTGAAPAAPDVSPATDENDKGDAAAVSPAASASTPRFARRFHWKQDLPHANYLVTMVVSRFDVVNVGGPNSARPGLWMPVYGPLGSGEAIRQTFANTPAMIAYFEELFGVPYPWDKYAQIMCRDFSAGAMENTGAVTFNSSLGRGRRGSQDSIISHELVHHWFGDLVTCKSWEHLWLNEGWATLGEALWAEKVRGHDGYQAAILRNMESERLTSRRRTLPMDNAMVSHRYRNPDQRFTSADNVYQKGGAVLHMLRERVGDQAFWTGVRTYLKRHGFDQVETDDFRIAMEEASGQSLERFFDQWCRRPGLPSLEIDYTWTPSNTDSPEHGPGTLTVNVEQVQTVDADNPAYAFTLPVYVTHKDANRRTTGSYVFVVTDSKTASAEIALPAKPTDLEVDPYLTVLARASVRQPLETTLRQTQPGRTLATRVRAMRMLAESGDPRAIRTLIAFALPTLELHPPANDEPEALLRHEARRALASALDHSATAIRTAVARSFDEYRSLALGAR